MKHQIIVTDINLRDFDGKVGDYLIKGWKVVHLSCAVDSNIESEPNVVPIRVRRNNAFVAILESSR